MAVEQETCRFCGAELMMGFACRSEAEVRRYAQYARVCRHGAQRLDARDAIAEGVAVYDAVRRALAS